MKREWDWIRDQIAIDIQILGKQLEQGKRTPEEAIEDLLSFAEFLHKGTAS